MKPIVVVEATCADDATIEILGAPKKPANIPDKITCGQCGGATSEHAKSCKECGAEFIGTATVTITATGKTSAFRIVGCT